MVPILFLCLTCAAFRDATRNAEPQSTPDPSVPRVFYLLMGTRTNRDSTSLSVFVAILIGGGFDLYQTRPPKQRNNSKNNGDRVSRKASTTSPVNSANGDIAARSLGHRGRRA